MWVERTELTYEEFVRLTSLEKCAKCGGDVERVYTSDKDTAYKRHLCTSCGDVVRSFVHQRGWDNDRWDCCDSTT